MHKLMLDLAGPAKWIPKWRGENTETYLNSRHSIIKAVTFSPW